MAYTQFFSRILSRGRKKLRVASDGLLADQESLNLGTLFSIPPAVDGTSGVNKLGNPVRLLNIEGSDADGESIIVTIQQEVALLEPTAMPVPGPLIGIVEFGSGSGFARIEFDIPSPVGGPAPNFAVNAAQSTAPSVFIPQKNNQVTLVLPASSIRVFARNDAQTGFFIDFNGTTVNNVQTSRNTPGTVRVHAAYGHANMVRERVRRQYFIAGGGATLQPPPAPDNSIIIGIPAYAKRVFFPRNPADLPLSVAILDYYGGAYSIIDLPGDDLSPIELPPHTSALNLINQNAQAFNTLAAVFELGF